MSLKNMIAQQPVKNVQKLFPFVQAESYKMKNHANQADYKFSTNEEFKKNCSHYFHVCIL